MSRNARFHSDRQTLRNILRGAGVGLLAGLAVGALGEIAVLIVREMFPTDVAIVGFVLILAVPLGGIVGALGGWLDSLADTRRLATVAAVPGLIAGIFTVAIQLSAV